MQQFLNFFPLPQGHGSFRPTRGPVLRIASIGFSSPDYDRFPDRESVSPIESGSASRAETASCLVTEVILHK